MGIQHQIKSSRLEQAQKLFGVPKPVATPVASSNHVLDLGKIQIDGGTQSRAELNPQVVEDYADAIRAGATFPPIVVFYDGKKHWLADGFHRFHAYQKAGKSKVAADIRQGTRRDAILHSVGANEAHGLRRTNDDKRRAVLTLLNDAEWSTWTDREIGRACQVDHKTVGKIRAELPGEILTERVYTTKHGTTATMKTAGINAGRKFQAKASEDNGSITGGAGAVTGEVSRLASGRTDAGEAASVDLPTNPKMDRATEGSLETGSAAAENAREAIPAKPGDGYVSHAGAGEIPATISDEDREYEALQQAWDAAGEGARARFLAAKAPAPHSNPPKPVSSPVTADTAGGRTGRPSPSATPFINPHCQKPDTCKWAKSQASCSPCANAASKARAAAA